MRNRFQWLVSCIVLCTVLLGVRSAHGQLAAPAIVGGSIATANEFQGQSFGRGGSDNMVIYTA